MLSPLVSFEVVLGGEALAVMLATVQAAFERAIMCEFVLPLDAVNTHQ